MTPTSLWRRLWKRFLTSDSRPPRRRPPRGFAPSLESLEARALPTTLIWIGGHTGDELWSNPAEWSTGTVPQAGDTVEFTKDSRSSIVDRPFTVSLLIDPGYRGGLAIAGSSHQLNGSLDLTGTSRWAVDGKALGIFIIGGGRLTVDDGAVVTLAGAGTKIVNIKNGTLTNNGTINETGTGILQNVGLVPIVNGATGTYNLQSDAGIEGAFENAGTLAKTGGTGTSTLTRFNKTVGTHNVETGFTNKGGTIKVQSGALTVDDPTGALNTGATFVVNGGSSLTLDEHLLFPGTYTGNYAVSGTGTVTFTGSVAIGAGGATFGFPGATFNCDAGSFFGQIQVKNNVVTLVNGVPLDLGANGKVTNKTGGTLALAGPGGIGGKTSLINQPGSTLEVTLYGAGDTPINLTTPVDLNKATLKLHVAAGYTPHGGDVLTMITSTSGVSGVLDGPDKNGILSSDGTAFGISYATRGVTATVPFTPSQIRHAYGFDQIPLDGSGQTIAIIVAYDDPKFVNSSDPGFTNSDLHQFDVAVGLPDPPGFRKVGQDGATNLPSTPPTASDWSSHETIMDVKWAHAIAPKANILLVEANSRLEDDMLVAVNTARNQSGVSVVSMSWSRDESLNEKKNDGYFTTPPGHAGVTFVASSGDLARVRYPAASPNVLAVGGTTLQLDANDSIKSEMSWASDGGGNSVFESEPAYQRSAHDNGMRTTPDVAYDASSNPGFSVYDSYGGGWTVSGGTSAGAPQWAALIAVADQGRVANKLGTLDGPTQTLPLLYYLGKQAHWGQHGWEGDFNHPEDAPARYNIFTGLGSPRTNLLVPDMQQGPEYMLQPNGDLTQLWLGASKVISSDVRSFAVGNDGTLYVLQNNNTLVSYLAGNTMTLDSSCESFAITTSGTLYVLGPDNRLLAHIAGVPVPVTVDTDCQSFAVSPDGATLYALQTNGDLVQDPAGTATTLDTGVQAFALSPNGSMLYVLENNGNLRRNVGGTWTLLDGGVKSFIIGPKNIINVLERNGNLKQFNGPKATPRLLAQNIVKIWPVNAGHGLDALEANGTILQFPTTTQLQVTAPGHATAGTWFSITVTALTGSGKPDGTYRGTLHFITSDASAVIPTDYTFTAADHGTHTFSITLKTASTPGFGQTVTVIDTANNFLGSVAVALSPGAASTLFVGGFPTATTAGKVQSFTVMAEDPFGNIASGYTGTVHFSSSDPQAALLGDYKFTAADAGLHAFTKWVALKTAGSQTLTATDAVTASITGTETGITVSAAGASKLAVVGPASATAGNAFSLTVTAQDAYGNAASGYTRKVHFSSSDSQAVLPGDYTFMGGDQGTHAFSVTLGTVGSESVTVADPKGLSSSTTVTVDPKVVPPAGPSGLAATAVSSSQITVTWVSHSTKESGFLVERKSGTAGSYAQIATVGAGVTSYSDGGLAPATQYTYRVRAYNSAGASPYSNEASATTADVPPAAPSNLATTAATSTRINLTWVDNSTNESGFLVERRDGPAGSYAQVATLGAGVTSYRDGGLTPSTLYTYRVRAYNAAGTSAYSNQSSSTTLDFTPSVVSAIREGPGFNFQHVAFAIAADHSVWRHDASGWLNLSGYVPGPSFVTQVSASTDASGHASVFAVAADRSVYLWIAGGNWLLVGNRATQISATGGDELYAIGLDHGAWQWTLQGGWLYLGNYVTQISAGTTGLLFAVDSKHQAYSWSLYTGWQLLGNYVTQISANASGLFAVAGDHTVYSWTRYGGWKFLGGYVTQITTGGYIVENRGLNPYPDELFAIDGTQTAYKWTLGGGWVKLGGPSITDISGIADDTVFAFATDHSLMEYNSAGWVDYGGNVLSR
jgi:hypothetical protein